VTQEDWRSADDLLRNLMPSFPDCPARDPDSVPYRLSTFKLTPIPFDSLPFLSFLLVPDGLSFSLSSSDWWVEQFFTAIVTEPVSHAVPVVILDSLKQNPACGAKVDSYMRVYDKAGVPGASARVPRG
jgi:hypothetical protein